MTKEAVYVGVDVAKDTLDIAVSNSAETQQFAHDHEGITQATHHIASLQPAGIILEATGRLEMPLGRASVQMPASDHHKSPSGTRLRPCDWCSSQD